MKTKWSGIFLCIIVASLFNSLYGDTLSITTNPAALVISDAIAGQNPSNAVNSSTRYSLSTTNKVTIITGKINTNMPSGVTLQLQLAAPSGATSAGSVSMTTTDANLVTAIPRNITATNLTITYTLSATVAAAKVTNATKTLTLTLQ